MALEWAWALAERGHNVHLLRTGDTPRDAALARQHRSRAPTLHHVPVPEHPVVGGPSEVAAMASAILTLHEARPLDVVHIHYALPFALVAPLLRSLTSPPTCVVSLHGTDVTGIGGSPAYAPALRVALRSADVLTAPGPWLAAEAETAGFARHEAVKVLPNFVDFDRFHPLIDGEARRNVAGAFRGDDGTPVVAHVSNFRAVKRGRDAIDAVRALPTRARLLMIGDGPERAALEAHARATLGPDVAFPGAIDDPAPWLREADALILPSSSESFGLVALEALASGTPVVASRIGGLVDWLEGTPAATLCAVGDTAALARALSGFIGAGRTERHARVAARDHATRYGSSQRSTEILEALLEVHNPAADAHSHRQSP
jgi:N-acetyl-alpha-D-glucosaminyl L-malate synthase BshA